MNITKLESIFSYKALCNVIAILGGIFAVVSALAPDTISGLYDMTSKATESDNWVNAGRTSWIATGSVAFLASWARFVEEIYAQKIIMKFFSFFMGAFALSNVLHGIEKTASLHPFSIGSLAALFLLSWFCWIMSRGVEPNTKSLGSSNKITVLPSDEDKEASGQ